mmetsp:Transcript_6612/g.15944  ORF Transcript_6612/g.15944 Transcript_6612/m.15944 type:complete len:276 (-) Transcript_6612:31-858(-)
MRIRSSRARAALMTSPASLLMRSSHFAIHDSMSPCPMSSSIISLLLSATLLSVRSSASVILSLSVLAESVPPSSTSAFCTDDTTCLWRALPISISAALFWVPTIVSLRSISVLDSSETIFVVHSLPSISLSTWRSCVVAWLSFSYSYGCSVIRRFAVRDRFWASGPSPMAISSADVILTRMRSMSAGKSGMGACCASRAMRAMQSRPSSSALRYSLCLRTAKSSALAVAASRWSSSLSLHSSSYDMAILAVPGWFWAQRSCRQPNIRRVGERAEG